MPVFQINFSRPAGQIVAQYYNFVRLGRERLPRRPRGLLRHRAKFLAEEIVKLGPFELLCDGDPATGIPSVAWRIREGEDPGTRSTTSPTGCGSRAGRCRPTR